MPILFLPALARPGDTPALRLQQLAIDQVRTQLATPAQPAEDQAKLRAQLRGLYTLPHSRLRR